MNSFDFEPGAPMPEGAHRILTAVAWVLFALGMIAWFIQGANRPLDPIVSPAAIVGLPLLLRHLTAR